MIPYGTQDITNEDIEAVTRTLKSAYLTQGPTVTIFEDALATYCGANHAVATNSATSALHVACLALELGPGDILWTTPNSFVASANCGLYCGASVDFVDIELKHFNICPHALKDKLLQARKTNQLPKVLVVVDFAGQPCRMKEIRQLAREFNFSIIEDASHAIGSSYLGHKTGSCYFSDITIFSFHPVKIITSGEGGCALTNNSELAEKMRLLMSHGITRDPSSLTKKEGPWYYEQQLLGFNYRMTDIHAALGESQLQRIDRYVAKRHHIADQYGDRLSDLPLVLPTREKTSYSALHLYPIQIKPNKNDLSRKELFAKLRDDGIGVNVHYIPIHLQPYYQALGFTEGTFPNAETYYSRTLTIPLHPKLAQKHIDYICDKISRYLK